MVSPGAGYVIVQNGLNTAVYCGYGTVHKVVCACFPTRVFLLEVPGGLMKAAGGQTKPE